MSIDVDLATLFNISNARLAYSSSGFTRSLALGIFAAMARRRWFFYSVLKDVMLYPLSHQAYQTNVKTGLQALVGARGFAHDDLSPKGFIRAQGEIWSARALPADQMIVAGTEVEIVSAEHMTVFVRTVVPDQKF